jgi:hypothetical protein
MTESKLLLLGCGILKKEVRYLIRKNKWPVETEFFDSALHCELAKLERCLTTKLANQRGKDVFVFYGVCHPLMEKMLETGNTFRTEGQNCIDMLLGSDLFTRELLQGAFFLLEEWAQRWTQMVTLTFGTKNGEVIKEMFRGDRKYLLCLRTRCSGDFSKEADEAGRLVDLPLRWMDVGLEHLEEILFSAITRKLKETTWRR